MRLWLVNRFYWPDEPATAQLLGDLAEGLAARGHEVHVLAGRSAAPGGSASAVRRGVSVHRIPSRPLPGESLPAKAAAFACFLGGALVLLTLRLRPGDRVVALTDPPLLGLAARLACGLRRAVLFHWIQDIHPEVSVAVLRSPGLRLLLRGLIPLRNLAWRGARGCAAPSASMASLVTALTRARPPALLLHNWAPAGLRRASAEDCLAERAALGLPADAFVLMYSGNLGRVHDMESIAGLLARLRDLERLHLVVVGRGAGLPVLQAACRRHGVEGRVHHLPPRPRERLNATLSCADMHLVTLLEGCDALVFPSKLYGIAAIGRPVLAITPPGSDLAALVHAHGLGAAGGPGELDALAADLRLRVQRHPCDTADAEAAAAAFLAHTGDAAGAVLFWERLLASGPKGGPC